MSVEADAGMSRAAPGWADVVDLTAVRAGALGDFVVTLPALRALAGPSRRLRLVGNAPAARALVPELFEEVGSVDEARWAGLFDDGASAPAARGAAVVLLQRHAEAAARLRRAGWEPLLGAAPYPPPESGQHVGEYLLRAVEPAAIGLDRPGEGGRPLAVGRLVAPRPDARRGAAERLRRLGVGGAYAAIHPGSGSRRKNWPLERFAEVARRIERVGARPLVLAGPADQQAAAALAGAGRWPVVGDLPLEELVGVLAGAALYVGNDSGVSHVAGAVGTPTVAVFGPTRALRWRPLGPRVEAVEPAARCALCAVAEERPAACDCIERVEVGAVIEAAGRVAGAAGQRSGGLAP